MHAWLRAMLVAQLCPRLALNPWVSLRWLGDKECESRTGGKNPLGPVAGGPMCLPSGQRCPFLPSFWGIGSP